MADETMAPISCDNRTACNTPTTSTPEDHPEVEVIWTPDVIQRVASIVCIMIITFVGNTAIIIVLSCSKFRKRNTRVNIFIINLAIGDLTVCFVSMTTEILFVAFGEWVLGAVMCKLLTYIQVVALASTTFILTTMGYDRYMAICQPLRFSSSISRARKMIVGSWVLAFIMAIPQLAIFVQTNDGYHSDNTIKYGCKSQGYTAMWQRKVYFTFMTLYILICPAIILSFCYINVARVVWNQGKQETYARNGETSIRRFIVNRGVISLAKIKTVKMTLCIILTFIICWTPYFVLTLISIYSDYTFKPPKAVMVFAETVSLLQSAVNPILYGVFNMKLFRGLLEVFCHERFLRKRMNSYNNTRPPNGFPGYTDSDERRRRLVLPESSNNSRQATRKDISDRAATSSKSDGSTDNDVPNSSTRSHTCIITESNKDGFKLRVRFMAKEVVQLNVQHTRCMYPDIPCEEDSNIECQV